MGTWDQPLIPVEFLLLFSAFIEQLIVRWIIVELLLKVLCEWGTYIKLLLNLFRGNRVMGNVFQGVRAGIHRYNRVWNLYDMNEVYLTEGNGLRNGLL